MSFFLYYVIKKRKKIININYGLKETVNPQNWLIYTFRLADKKKLMKD
jgi:hypothetical protein